MGADGMGTYDHMDAICRAVKDARTVFGRVQLIMVLDPLQLPPAADPLYDGKFCFLSKMWSVAIPHLGTIYRTTSKETQYLRVHRLCLQFLFHVHILSVCKLHRRKNPTPHLWQIYLSFIFLLANYRYAMNWWITCIFITRQIQLVGKLRWACKKIQRLEG